MIFFSTEKMKFLCDNVKLQACGCVLSERGEVCLIGVTDDGEHKILRRDEVGAEFSIEYEFDPISYAVYCGSKSFYAAVSSDSEDFKCRIDKLSLEEFSSDVRIPAESDDGEGEKYAPPSKTLFIGNSLLFGMGEYGMCSSGPDKDYFYYVSKYIKKHRSDAEFSKLYGSSFEHSESLEAFERWYSEESVAGRAPACESFTDDIELVLIQLGDNINTDLKYETFKLTGDMLISRIREHSPRARIIWIHGWYSRPHVYTEIAELCKRQRIERLDIRSARSWENEAHDQPYYLGPDGTLMPTRETWLTHPGDRGMKSIAEKIINKLNIE